jgi:zinc D-Ala-D-Ala carboxypeptidase
MDPDFMERLQALRVECGFPFRINSGYRHPTHPIEAAKKEAGEHSTGKAADIGVELEQAYRVLELAPKHGFTRIGINQKGSGRYIHLGTSKDLPHPRVWSY